MEQTKRAFSTAWKQIKRSGWLGWASVSVMTLAFLISSIFGLIAYTSNLFLQSVEREPQIYAFFEEGTEEDKIFELKRQWESLNGVAYIEYTSEEQAKSEFYQAQKEINELAAQAVEERELPASLAIRLESLEHAERISKIVLDAESEVSEIKTVRFSKEIVDNIKQIFFGVRIGGGIIMVLLLIVIVLFTLLTVEFRMHIREEEIGIMQLVGGSLGYIRLPFIIEGAFYGFIGALISNLILTGLYAFIKYHLEKNNLTYFTELFSRIDWPELTPLRIAAVFASVLLAGLVLSFSCCISTFNEYSSTSS